MVEPSPACPKSAKGGQLTVEPLIICDDYSAERALVMMICGKSSLPCKEQAFQKPVEPYALRRIMQRHQLVLFFAALRTGLAVDRRFRLLPAAEDLGGAFRVKLNAKDLVAIAEGLIGVTVARGQESHLFWKGKGVIMRFGHMQSAWQEIVALGRG